MYMVTFLFSIFAIYHYVICECSTHSGSIDLIYPYSGYIVNDYKLLSRVSSPMTIETQIIDNISKSMTISKPRIISELHGSYTPLEMIGAGGFGEVWRGISLSREFGVERVVLKRLRNSSHTKDNPGRLSGIREIYFGNLIKNLPHCGRFLESFERSIDVSGHVPLNYADDITEDKQKKASDLWLVFADEGENLFSKFFQIESTSEIQPSSFWLTLRSNAAGLPVIFLLFRQLCIALNVLHRRGIVHRDVKLQNILLKQSFPVDIRLIDFGSAIKLSFPWDDNIGNKQLHEDMLLDGFFPPNGPSGAEETRLLQPPEVLRRIASVRGPEFDTWSAGVVLMQLLTGLIDPVGGGSDVDVNRLKSIFQVDDGVEWRIRKAVAEAERQIRETRETDTLTENRWFDVMGGLGKFCLGPYKFVGKEIARSVKGENSIMDVVARSTSIFPSFHKSSPSRVVTLNNRKNNNNNYIINRADLTKTDTSRNYEIAQSGRKADSNMQELASEQNSHLILSLPGDETQSTVSPPFSSGSSIMLRNLLCDLISPSPTFLLQNEIVVRRNTGISNHHLHVDDDSLDSSTIIDSQNHLPPPPAICNMVFQKKNSDYPLSLQRYKQINGENMNGTMVETIPPLAPDTCLYQNTPLFLPTSEESSIHPDFSQSCTDTEFAILLELFSVGNARVQPIDGLYDLISSLLEIEPGRRATMQDIITHPIMKEAGRLGKLQEEQSGTIN